MQALLGGKHRAGPIPGRLRPTSRWQLLPSGLKALGSNMVPTPTQLAASEATPSPTVWNRLWTDWLWTAELKPQIDKIDAIPAATNCVRIIGSVEAVTSGAISRATYLARWTQLIDYAWSLGLYTYVCGGAINDIDIGISTSSISAEVIALAGLVHQKSDRVFAFDLIQEAMTSTTAPTWAITNGPTLAAAVKQVTNVPITFSFAAASGLIADSVSHNNALRGYVDFWDYHVYTDYTASAFDAIWATDDKPILFGEFGANQAATSGERTSRYTATKANVAHVGPAGQRMAGALSWAIVDHGTADNRKWGLYDASGNLRTDMSDVYVTFPTT